MKAVVCELIGKEAVVMNDEGVFCRIANDNYSIGEELEITGRSESGSDRILAFVRKNMPVAAAAVVFVAALSGGFAFARSYTCSVVTLDINPSLKYNLNIFDKVIDMDSFNDDGSEIVSVVGEDSKGTSLENAVRLTLDELDKTGYVGKDTSVVVTLGSRTNSEDSLETQVIGSVGKWNNEKSVQGEEKSVNVETVRVTPQMADSAKEKNVSPGKIYIVGKLKEQVLESAEFQEDEWLDKSVKEIEEAANSISAAGTNAKEDLKAGASLSEDGVVIAKNGDSGSKTVTSEDSRQTSEAPKAVNGSKKGTGKSGKKNSTSENDSLSTNGTVLAGTEDLGEGTGLSGEVAAVTVSEDQIPETSGGETDPALVQPSISPEPEDSSLPTDPETTVFNETMEIPGDQPV